MGEMLLFSQGGPLMMRLIAMALVLGGAVGCSTDDSGATLPTPLEITVTVSPQTLVLGSQGEWVTVHADIAYSQVDTVTLLLNEIEVSTTKSDANGSLVAKFELDSVKDIVGPPEATFVLEGATRDGTPFAGSDTVRVTNGN
jgi:hypothetical protein